MRQWDVRHLSYARGACHTKPKTAPATYTTLDNACHSAKCYVVALDGACPRMKSVRYDNMLELDMICHVTGDCLNHVVTSRRSGRVNVRRHEYELHPQLVRPRGVDQPGMCQLD